MTAKAKALKHENGIPSREKENRMIPRRKFFKTLLAAGLLPGLGPGPWLGPLIAGEPGQPSDKHNANSKNRIIGIGTAGINILDHLLESGIQGVDAIASHTDLYRLACSRAGTKIPLVVDRVETVGDENLPEFQLTPAARTALWDSIQGSEDLTIVVGLGGKTGSSFARVIARSGHEVGTFVRMVATMPFPFEGKARLHRAEEALMGLGLYVNESIIFNNDFVLDPGYEVVEFLDFPEMKQKANVLLVKIIKEALFMRKT
jgi:cell division GTPase FtsZ